MTSPRAVLQRPSMETPKHQFNTRVCPSPMDTSALSSHSIRGEAPVPNRADGSASGSLDVGRDRPPLPSAPRTGLKPMADETRRMPPFGSPKREGRLERTRRNTGGVASSQVDSPQGRTGARAQLHGRWRDRSPLRIPECMDGPASPVSVRPPAALREVRLNGSPGALVEVSRHRCDGGRSRGPGSRAQGLVGRGLCRAVSMSSGSRFSL